MDNIIIYTTSKKLSHKRDLLTKGEDEDKSNNGVYYWRFNYLPKSWKDVEQMNNLDIQKKEVKIYFATEKFIRGYFILSGIEPSAGFDIEFKSDSWKDIIPIPITHFQGFKYAYKVPELNEVK